MFYSYCTCIITEILLAIYMKIVFNSAKIVVIRIEKVYRKNYSEKEDMYSSKRRPYRCEGQLLYGHLPILHLLTCAFQIIRNPSEPLVYLFSSSLCKDQL